MSEWENIGGFAPIWKPQKKGDTIQGTVVRSYEGNYGTAIDVKTSRGTFTLPAHKNLQPSYDVMAVGDEIKIEYRGKGTSKKGRQFEEYSVLRRRAK
jgi:hypothetical protein